MDLSSNFIGLTRGTSVEHASTVWPHSSGSRRAARRPNRAVQPL